MGVDRRILGFKLVLKTIHPEAGKACKSVAYHYTLFRKDLMKTRFSDGLTKALRIHSKIDRGEPLTKDEERWLKAEKRRRSRNAAEAEKEAERFIRREERYEKKVKRLSVGTY